MISGGQTISRILEERLKMKFVVFFIVLQLYVANSKSLSVLPRPCHRSDPNFTKCLIDLLQEGMHLLATGIPEYYIPRMDPYTISRLEKNITFEDFAEGSVTLKNVKITNILDAKINNLSIDLNDLSGEIELVHPDIKVALEYNADGNLLETPMHTEGSFEGKFADIKCHFKLKMKTVERNYVKYFAIKDFKLNARIGNAHINVITRDEEHQKIVNFIQNIFNQDPRRYLDSFNPLYVGMAEDHIKSIIGAVLTVIPANVLLPE